MVMHLLVVAIHLLTQLTGRVFPGKPGPFLQTSPGEPKTCLWLIDWTQWNYHLVMTNRASHGIDGPNWNRWFTMVYLLKMVDLSVAMLNNQMVYEAPWSYLQARNKCRGPHNNSHPSGEHRRTRDSCNGSQRFPQRSPWLKVSKRCGAESYPWDAKSWKGTLMIGEKHLNEAGTTKVLIHYVWHNMWLYKVSSYQEGLKD